MTDERDDPEGAIKLIAAQLKAGSLASDGRFTEAAHTLDEAGIPEEKMLKLDSSDIKLLELGLIKLEPEWEGVPLEEVSKTVPAVTVPVDPTGLTQEMLLFANRPIYLGRPIFKPRGKRGAARKVPLTKYNDVKQEGDAERDGSPAWRRKQLRVVHYRVKVLPVSGKDGHQRIGKMSQTYLDDCIRPLADMLYSVASSRNLSAKVHSKLQERGLIVDLKRVRESLRRQGYLKLP